MMSTVWNPVELMVVVFGMLVFFFCLGFSLWRALSAAQSGVYWHIVLCLNWVGVICTAIAGSRAEVWTVMLDAGYAMLALGIAMTFSGIAWLVLHHITLQRDRYQHQAR